MKLTLLLLLCALTLRAEVVTVTAYCPCARCCGKWSAAAHTGKRFVAEGVTCAGPRRLPLGTRVWFEGLGWRVITDRKARRCDGWEIYFARHADAKRFGTKRINVSILSRPPMQYRDKPEQAISCAVREELL